LQDGTVLKKEFPATTTLNAVREWMILTAKHEADRNLREQLTRGYGNDFSNQCNKANFLNDLQLYSFIFAGRAETNPKRISHLVAVCTNYKQTKKWLNRFHERVVCLKIKRWRCFAKPSA
jgi:hypothetical protein